MIFSLFISYSLYFNYYSFIYFFVYLCIIWILVSAQFVSMDIILDFVSEIVQ